MRWWSQPNSCCAQSASNWAIACNSGYSVGGVIAEQDVEGDQGEGLALGEEADRVGVRANCRSSSLGLTPASCSRGSDQLADQPGQLDPAGESRGQGGFQQVELPTEAGGPGGGALAVALLVEPLAQRVPTVGGGL